MAIGIVLGLTSDETSGSNSWPTPYPTPRPTTYQYCNGKRTGGTPGWKDSSGDNCDWYEEHDRDCSDASMYAGSMGTANENCCLCIVPASPTTMPSYSWYMTPKPSPYPTPKLSPYPLSSCSDHTNPQDSNGTPVGQIQMGEVAVGIRAQDLIIAAKTLETSIMVAWVQLMRTAATVCCN